MTETRVTNDAANPRPLRTVVGQVKGWVERLGWVWVEAQIIEINRRQGPTQFLTLRDRVAEVSVRVTCTSAILDAAGPLPEGSQVVARLTPRVWQNSGSLSFECSEIQVQGEGRLLAQIEQLKRKLQAEGLFDSIRKKSLPFLPKGIGLITGANSAAERDVITNTHLRWPAARFIVEHRTMQGPNSAADVMDGLARLDANPAVDLIVIARGGGSLEDLLPFSDEGLVRAVAACRTPVVSAIGHEPDSPILDLVADLRASTPTDAAKRIVPDAAQEAAGLNQTLQRLRGTVMAILRTEQSALDQIRSRPVLRNPVGSFDVHHDQIASLRARATTSMRHAITNQSHQIDSLRARARALSPRATLERGYAIVAADDGASVTSVTHTTAGDGLAVYLADGQLHVTVDDITAAPKEPS